MRVDVDLSAAMQKLSDKALQRGRYALANQTLADMNRFVPMDEGILRMGATIGIDGTAIHYNAPYSSRMFYYKMHNYTTPGTGPRWDNKAKSIYMKDWEKALMKGAGW